jgi:cephalosporin-C deacetylase-like acetyl esterase
MAWWLTFVWLVLQVVNGFEPQADLPALLQFDNGSPVVTPTDWSKRREEIKELLMQYIIGSFPSTVPSISKVQTLNTSTYRGVVDEWVRLTFDTSNSATFDIEIMRPDAPGPFPVFMTQYWHRGWAQLAVSRNYLAFIYPGSDNNDACDIFKAAYPQATWGRISRRAWLGSRALDYVYTLPNIVKSDIAISGHSRNGKQSVIATAFDDRITSVVSSSSGAPVSSSYRFSGRPYLSEAPSDYVADWFLEELKNYTGYENRLPIDAHGFLSLVAPRPLLIYSALNDEEGDTTFAIERTYTAAQEVYTLLNATENLRIQYRWGNHHGADCPDELFDWFDNSFGYGRYSYPQNLIHDFNWDAWNATQTERKPPANSNITDVIKWFLGDEPGMVTTPGSIVTTEWPYIALLLERDHFAVAGVTREPIVFGEYIMGSLYYTTNAKGPLPAVIYINPYSYYGPVDNYGTQGPTDIYNLLAQKGFLVMQFDKMGFSYRQTHATNFYSRYPRWSKLGKMVRDVRAAVDFLLATNFGYINPITRPLTDPHHIYVAGYSLGGLVSLYSAALDNRIAGVASIAAFAPLRTDTYLATGGIERLYEWHGLMPRLGFYQNTQKDLPYDYDDVLSLVAPRSTLIVSPTQDRDNNFSDVSTCVQNAQIYWNSANASKNLTFVTPNDYSRFSYAQYPVLIDWLLEVSKIQ